MPIVEVNGQELEFPDDMGQDQIKAVLQKKFAPKKQPEIDKMKLVAGLVSEAMPTTPFTAISKHVVLPAIADPKGAARAAVDQVPQGGTAGFADELIDKATSGVVSNRLDMPYDDVYNIAREMSKDQLAKDWKEQPGISLGSQALGGYGTGKLVGKALGPLDRLGRGGKAVQNIATTEGLGALYGAGTAEDGERGSGALTGAVGATAVSRGIPWVASLADKSLKGIKNAVQGLSAQTPDEVQATIEAIKNQSRQNYAAMRSAGAVINPQHAQQLTDDVTQAVIRGEKVNPRLHKDTLGLLDDFANETQGGPLDVESLDQWRQLFRDVVNRNTDIKGAQNGDARLALKAIDKIDDVLESLQPQNLMSGATSAVEALQKGRQGYAQSKRMQDIQSILERSEGDANALKRNLNNFLSKKKNLAGWTQEEISALEDAATNTGGELLLKMFGKLGFDLGASRAPGNAALPGIAAVSGHMPEVALGTAARSTHKSIAAAKAQKLVDMLGARGDPNKIAQLLMAQQPPVPAINQLGQQGSLLTNLLMKP
jgi:hypothetical protein